MELEIQHGKVSTSRRKFSAGRNDFADNSHTGDQAIAVALGGLEPGKDKLSSSARVTQHV
jgi:hypothetical protein